MTQPNRLISEHRPLKSFLRRERQLCNPKYTKYLYEKYKVTFSVIELQFTFNEQHFRRAAPLVQQLHRYESTEINLNMYVFALFLVLLCAVMYSVYAIDLYLQSFH
jgi:hypothetical protein